VAQSSPKSIQVGSGGNFVIYELEIEKFQLVQISSVKKRRKISTGRLIGNDEMNATGLTVLTSNGMKLMIPLAERPCARLERSFHFFSISSRRQYRFHQCIAALFIRITDRSVLKQEMFIGIET
jgi:hypothetical protein